MRHVNSQKRASFQVTVKRRVKYKWFDIDEKYRGIVAHSVEYSIDWLTTETSRVEQGYCKPLASYPLLRVFAKQVREKVLTFKKFPGEALVGRCP